MSIYCTYLTTYRGNKLPPFYIGYSTVTNVEEGYHGSVSSSDYDELWRDELFHNPHLFQTKIITTHKTRLEAIEREQSFQRALKVVRNPLYTNKAIGCHYDWTGKTRSENQKKLLSEINLGKTLEVDTKEKIRQARLGVPRPKSTKEKIRQSKTGKPLSDQHRKNVGLGQKGYRWWTNGYQNTRSRECPGKDFHIGRIIQ